MEKWNRSRGAPAVAEDDDLEEHSPARRHGRGRIWEGRGRDRGAERRRKSCCLLVVACGLWGRGLEIPPGVLGDPRGDCCAGAALGKWEWAIRVPLAAAALFACWVRSVTGWLRVPLLD